MNNKQINGLNKFGIKLAFISLIFTFSCNDNSAKNGIVDASTMAKVLAELQITEAKIARIQVDGIDSVQAAFNYLKADIYKKNNIDSATFVKSYDYYAHDKAQLIKIYDQAEKILIAKRKVSTTKPKP